MKNIQYSSPEHRGKNGVQDGRISLPPEFDKSHWEKQLFLPIPHQLSRDIEGPAVGGGVVERLGHV